MDNPSFRTWLSLRAYGAVTSTLFRASTPPLAMRRRFERFGRTARAVLQRRHPGLVFGDHSVGRLPIESVCAVPDPRTAVLYLHGGAFVMGSAASYRSRASRVSYRCRAEVFVPEYRLAPEHPFPGALEDAVEAWRYLVSLQPEGPVLVAGDSAGGGLALSLVVMLRALGERLPDGAVLLSPWLDLSDSGGQGPPRDLWFTPAHLQRWSRHYLGRADARNPLVSPAYADPSGLCPLLVLAGEDELLLGDACRFVDRARAAGTDARLHVGTGMQHDWPLTLPWLDESRRAWAAIAAFVDERSAAWTAEAMRRESKDERATARSGGGVS